MWGKPVCEPDDSVARMAEQRGRNAAFLDHAVLAEQGAHPTQVHFVRLDSATSENDSGTGCIVRYASSVILYPTGEDGS